MATLAKANTARLFHGALMDAIALTSWAQRDCPETGWRHAKEGCRLAGEIVRLADRLQEPEVESFLAECPPSDAKLPAMGLYAESWHRLVALIAIDLSVRILETMGATTEQCRVVFSEDGTTVDVAKQEREEALKATAAHTDVYWPAIATALKELPRIASAENEIKAGMAREWIEMERRAVEAEAKRAAKRPGGRRKKLPTERPLTQRQTEVAQVVAECNGNVAEAAKRLGVHHSTAQEHYNAALEKLGRAAVKHKTTSLKHDRRGQAGVADGDDRR